MVGLILLTASAFTVNGTVVASVPPGVITATLFNTGVVCCPSGWLLLLASGQVENFNGRLGDESLNAHRFMTLMEARHHNDRWPGQYNQERPQSSLVDLKATRIGQRCKELKLTTRG